MKVTVRTTALEHLHLLSYFSEARSLCLSLILSFPYYGAAGFPLSACILTASGPSLIGSWALSLLFCCYFMVSEFDQTWILDLCLRGLNLSFFLCLGCKHFKFS